MLALVLAAFLVGAPYVGHALVATNADVLGTLGTSDYRDEFDCLMRAYAIEYAQDLQPLRASQVFHDIADALDGTPEKAPGCTVSFQPTMINSTVTAMPTSRFPLVDRNIREPSTGGLTIYVATDGSDSSGDGTSSSPFATLIKAVDLSRKNPGFDTIVMREGTYYQDQAVVLTAKDQGLTIQNQPGDEVWLSGAMPLRVKWSQTTPPPRPTPTWKVIQNTSFIFGGTAGEWPFLVNSSQDTWEGCEAACKANHTAGGDCTVWTWHSNETGGYARECWFRMDHVADATTDVGHVAGYLEHFNPFPPNVWKTSLAGTGIKGVPGLRLDGKRLTRARFPNADPERDGMMPPKVFRGNWTQQSAPRLPDQQVDMPASELLRNTTPSMFQTFTAGIGGTCSRFDPPAGYWV